MDGKLLVAILFVDLAATKIRKLEQGAVKVTKRK